MIFKCLWLHSPFLSLFLYSQTLKADEVTVGSVLLSTALPMLFSSHATVVAADWAALQSSHEFQFPLGSHFWLSVLPKWGKSAPTWSHTVLPGARTGGKQRGAADQASSGSSLTPLLAWVMGTGPVSLSCAPSTPGMRRHRHHSAQQGQGREKWQQTLIKNNRTEKMQKRADLYVGIEC